MIFRNNTTVNITPTRGAGGRGRGRGRGRGGRGGQRGAPLTKEQLDEQLDNYNKVSFKQSGPTNKSMSILIENVLFSDGNWLSLVEVLAIEFWNEDHIRVLIY